MPKYPRLAFSNDNPAVAEKGHDEDYPQTMFFRFALSTKLDINGMNGAQRFLSLFMAPLIIGNTPIRCPRIFRRFRSKDALIDLILKYGGSCSGADAENFIKNALGQRIYYKTRATFKTIRINNQDALVEVEDKRYFILREQIGMDRYYLILTDD